MDPVGHQDLEMIQTRFVKGIDFGSEGGGLLEVGGFGKTVSGCLLGINEPGGELLDARPVLSPVLDVLGEVVALNLDLGLEIEDIGSDSVELVLVVLGILGDGITWLKKYAF